MARLDAISRPHCSRSWSLFRVSTFPKIRFPFASKKTQFQRIVYVGRDLQGLRRWYALFFFLIADTQLYRRFVRPSVGPTVMIESASGKTSVLDTFCVCVWESGDWGAEGGWTPLPTRLQGYCDPRHLFFQTCILSLWLSSVASGLSTSCSFYSQRRNYDLTPFPSCRRPHAIYCDQSSIRIRPIQLPKCLTSVTADL